jgi:hypothetical protein
MSAAYSMLTLGGMVLSGSSRLVATGRPASSNAWVGALVRLVAGALTLSKSAGSAWQFVQLASPEIGSTVSVVATTLVAPGALPSVVTCTRTRG